MTQHKYQCKLSRQEIRGRRSPRCHAD